MKKQEANQIKSELFSSIRELGLQDELKTHLRIQLCQKLKQKDLIKKEQSHEDKLYNRIMVSLISEQLTASDCRYSNSIYTAESGYDMKILSRNEIIQVMGISEQDLNPNFSVISNLMKKKYPFSGSTIKSISIQTNPEEVGYTIEQRLALIDQQYRKNITFGTVNKEEADYQKKLQQLEADLKRNYQKDLERFKEFESHSIKVKVSQEWRKKFQDYSHNISQDYKRKMDNLRKKERLLEDGIVSKNKVLDEKVNSSHKTFLNKIDLLDIKSLTMDEVKKNLEIERNRVKEEYNNREKQLKAKIREYDSLLITTKDKIQYEVGIAKLSIQQEYQQKNAEFLSRKKYIDEEYGKLMGIKDTTDVIKEENKRLFDENMRLRKDLTELEQELRITVSENGAKGDRLDSLRGELNDLNRSNNSKDETLKEQSKKIKKKDEQIIEIRKQLDKLRKFKEMQQQIEEAEERPRNPPETFKPSSLPAQMISKAEQLSKQRQKYIQQLKLEL